MGFGVSHVLAGWRLRRESQGAQWLKRGATVQSPPRGPSRQDSEETILCGSEAVCIRRAVLAKALQGLQLPADESSIQLM